MVAILDCRLYISLEFKTSLRRPWLAIFILHINNHKASL